MTSNNKKCFPPKVRERDLCEMRNASHNSAGSTAETMTSEGNVTIFPANYYPLLHVKRACLKRGLKVA